MHIGQTAVLSGSMDHIYDLNALSDEDLLRESLSSPTAFEVLVTRYQRTFLERAQYVVKSRDEAEDVVQEAFVRIYRFATKFEGSAGSFKSWAMTILMNVARTKYQGQVKHRGRVADLDPEHYESLAEPSEKEAALAKDTITRALEKAPEDVAEILTLAFIDDLPYQDIGARLNISVGAVKTRVHRAKKLLRDILST